MRRNVIDWQNSRIMKTKIHLEVSYASTDAIKAVEKAGGTVTCVHFNALGKYSESHPSQFLPSFLIHPSIYRSNPLQTLFPSSLPISVTTYYLPFPFTIPLFRSSFSFKTSAHFLLILLFSIKVSSSACPSHKKSCQLSFHAIIKTVF